jgi:hypothetical protein
MTMVARNAVLALGFLLTVGMVQAETVAPRRITLQGQMSLNKALQELCAQTGQGTATITAPADRGEEKVTVDWRDLSFWEALETLAKQTKTTVQIGERIRLVPSEKPTPGLVSLSGPFRIALKRITSSLDLESGSAQTHAFLEVAWEPRLQPFLLETRPQRLVLRDDRNKGLPPIETGSSVAPVDGRLSLLFEVMLPTPPRSTSRLALLEGELHAIGPSKMATFRFGTLEQLDAANPPPGTRVSKDNGLTCSITKLSLNAERWTVQLAVDTPPGGTRLESFQSWVVNNDMVLESTDGKRRLASSSYVVESVTERRAVVSYNFLPRPGNGLGKPGNWKVTYTSPVAVVTMPLTFRFKDVLLP